MDKFEALVGQWDPQNKFMRIFDAITELTEKVDCFDQASLERIGAKAKKLNKDMDEILTRL